MLRSTLTIILLLLLFKLNAQETDTLIGPPTGTLYYDSTIFESGLMKSVVYRDANKMPLRSVTFYMNGNVEQVLNYENGLLDGWSWSWYEDGFSKSNLIYWRDLLLGGTTWYPNGKIESFTVTSKGITTKTVYYENDSIKSLSKDSLGGMLYFEERCDNGRVKYIMYYDTSYQYREYYCDGQLKFSCKRNKSNALVGAFTQWHENGQVALTGRYVQHDGMMPIPDGTWTYFDAEGRRIKKEKYDKGKLISTK